MALKANSCDFFIGDDDENNSDPLSSDSDGGTEDTDSLSSLDSSDSDGMSRTSSDSMAYHDGEDEEQGYHPLMTKEMRECPISPEKQVALPNFLEVPTRKRVRGMRSGGSREHSSAIRFHPSATRFHPSNSPKLYFYRHDSRDKLLLDETTSPPENHTQSHVSHDGSSESRSGVPSPPQRLPATGSECRDGDGGHEDGGWWQRAKVGWTKSGVCKRIHRIDPQGNFFYFWTGLVSVSVLYNAVSIPLRFCFDIYSQSWHWLVSDYLFADLIYFLDIMLIKTHINFKFSGMKPPNEALILNYICAHRKESVLDILSLIPLEFLYVVPVLQFNPLLRITRLLKVHVLFKFHYLLESRTRSPNFYRIFKVLFYFTFIVHLYTCVYYLISRLEGLGVNDWVYSGAGIAYLRCFYIALLTVSNIHEQEERTATNKVEYVAEILGYMIGIFVLAVIIGELRYIVDTANAHQRVTKEYLEQLKLYMNHWKTPIGLRKRVQAWYTFALSQELDLNEKRVMKYLPKKMKSDLAIHVHLSTFLNVSLFKDCEVALLRELVLQLRPSLYLPGDYVCRKGDVGRDMYVVNKGLLEVLGGPFGNTVLTELRPGSAFGEISLLAVDVGRRRTATVRAKSFANLFILRKSDLDKTLESYPETREKFQLKAEQIVQQDKCRGAEEDWTEEGLTLVSKDKSKGMIRDAVSAMRIRAGVRSRVRPATLNLLREEKGKEKVAMEMEDIVHHHLQTDVAEHVVDMEACNLLEQCTVRSDDLCHDTEGPTRRSHDFCDVTTDGDHHGDPHGDVSIFRRFKERLFSSKKLSSESCPVVSTYNVDAYPFSFYSSASSSAIGTISTASIQPHHTNVWPLGEVGTPDHTPPGSSCSLEATMDIPGYIPSATTHSTASKYR